MKNMANTFWKKHRGSGRVTKVIPYSFTWETLPDKNEKTNQTVFYKSYFLNLKER